VELVVFCAEVPLIGSTGEEEPLEETGESFGCVRGVFAVLLFSEEAEERALRGLEAPLEALLVLLLVL
jgi:hypothetical protein